MISEHEKTITELREKIQIIISLYERQKKEKESLQQEKDNLTADLEKKCNEYDSLKEQFSVLKTAKSIAGLGINSREAKQKVNKIVREIDKCIALMNK